MDFLRRRKSSEDDDEPINGAVSDVNKSRKPPNTAFRQQRLKAWQPILTPKTVIPLLFILAVIFAPLGAAILHTTYNVEMLSVDYSKCHEQSGSFEDVPSKYVYHHFKHKNTDPQVKWRAVNYTDSFKETAQRCDLEFTLPKDLSAPIFLYYKLTNFYQNHREYLQSYDLNQLKGDAIAYSDLTSNCKPLRSSDQKAIYPCGLIANSYFNDTLYNPVLLNSQNNQNNQTYEFSASDISWPSDRSHKFKKTKYSPDDIVPPPNWYKMFPEGYNETNIPDLSQWEHLQNWMRTAGLPSFYKLYGKNTTETLSSGTYLMSIDLNYPVTIFGGSKTVVITTNSIFGGRNMALGIIYIVVAIVALVCGVGFLLQHLIKPRRIGVHDFLQGNNQISADISNYRDQL